MISEY